MARALINVPPKAKRGEIIEIKTLISHDMETGFRPDNTGKPIPRDIITDFVCKYNGEEVFRAELHPAIAANPFFTFTTIATASGTLTFEWSGDQRLLGAPRPRASPSNDRCRMNRVLAAVVACALACPLWAPRHVAAAEIPLPERKSGYDQMSRETRAMQDDDTSNPAMLWVLDGEASWNRRNGGAEKSCADCHGDARASMKGVAARYPAFDAASRAGRSISSSASISAAPTSRSATPLRYESKELLALTAYVGRQSRGTPIAVGVDAPSQPFLQAGRDAFNRRQGQLNLSCAQLPRRQLGAEARGRADPAGSPDRLSALSAGMAGRGIAAAAPAQLPRRHARRKLHVGAPELVDLELYLMWRARGMPLETPAVRP